MSVVVEQTIPWPTSELDLNNPKRWKDLFPLIRPSVKPVTTSKGQTILLNHALAANKHVQIAAIGKSGNFSSKFLSDQHIAAIVTETAGAGVLTARDVAYTLESQGIRCEHGLVVVRAGKVRRLEPLENGVVELETDGELEFDHVLSLLEHATETARSSIHETTELLKRYLKTAVCTQTAFHPEKKEDSASLIHEAHGHAEFETAKKALEKDLTRLLRSQVSQEGSIVHSVHYSDINGLSQLEKYILAHEISVFLDAQNIAYDLTSSSLVADDPLSARGWAISICALPSHFLPPTPKPPNPLSQPSSTAAPQPSTASSVSSEVPIKFEDASVRARITAGCTALIAAEPTITHYDTVVGDGDCGLTLRAGAQQALAFIENQDLAQLPQVLAALVDHLEVTMGGTSGALYCIFLSAFGTALQQRPATGPAAETGTGAAASRVPAALHAALQQLLQYTRARRGDRTCLDALVPFVEALAAGRGSEEAVREAWKGVKSTEVMQARVGRSTYLDESATRGVPDPGAYGLAVLVGGLCGVEGVEKCEGREGGVE